MIKRRIISLPTPRLFDHESKDFLLRYYISFQAEKNDVLYAKLISRKKVIQYGMIENVIMNSTEKIDQEDKRYASSNKDCQ